MSFEPVARRLLERLARGRAIWRRLPAEFGRAPLRVTPDAALSFLKPGRAAFDPMLFRLCDEHVRERQAVWDIGANVGIFSLAAAARGARVLAVEPDPWIFSLLMASKNHPKNRCYEIDVLCAAVSDAPGTAHLAIAERGRASNFLEAFSGRSDAGGSRMRCLVPVLTLDLLASSGPPPALVKIDVEGAEQAALLGASQLLMSARPKLLVEVGDATHQSVIALLQKAQYVVTDFETGLACEHGHQGMANLLAVPL